MFLEPRIFCSWKNTACHCVYIYCVWYAQEKSPHSSPIPSSAENSFRGQMSPLSPHFPLVGQTHAHPNIWSLFMKIFLDSSLLTLQDAEGSWCNSSMSHRCHGECWTSKLPHVFDPVCDIHGPDLTALELRRVFNVGSTVLHLHLYADDVVLLAL